MLYIVYVHALQPNTMSCVSAIVAVIWLLSLVYDCLEPMLRSIDMELSIFVVV